MEARTTVVFVLTLTGILATDFNVDDWRQLTPTTYVHKDTGDLLQPEAAGGHYQGDMRFPESHLRKRNMPWDVRTWFNGKVPYSFESPHDKDNSFTSRIRNAMNYIEARTCVRFVPWTGDQPNRIHFVREQGCSSYVGNIGWSRQNLDLHGFCVNSLGVVLHELLHALGFNHEHERADRGAFITVNITQVKPEWTRWFQVSNMKLTGGYDTDSVMHYGPYDFGKDYQYKTINQIGGLSHPIGQRSHLSDQDVKEINDLYNCQTKSDCLDTNENCTWWASVGECSKNPAYMLHNCKLSCKSC